LLEYIDIDIIMTRLPDAYLRAILASYLASQFVYEFGSAPSQHTFHKL
jgi:glutamate dehydrogenase